MTLPNESRSHVRLTPQTAPEPPPPVTSWATRAGTVVRVGDVEISVSNAGDVSVRQGGTLLASASPGKQPTQAPSLTIHEIAMVLRHAELSGVPLVLALLDGTSVTVESAVVIGRFCRCALEAGTACFPVSWIASVTRLDGRPFLPRSLRSASPGKQPQEPA